MKKKMEPPEMEFVVFDAADIIVTSGDGYSLYTGQFNMGSIDESEVYTESDYQ